MMVAAVAGTAYLLFYFFVDEIKVFLSKIRRVAVRRINVALTPFVFLLHLLL